MIDIPPPIRLLEAIKQTLEPVDYLNRAGLAGVRIRHRRNRNTKAGERPCIAIAFVDDDGPDDDQLDLTCGERQRSLTVDLIADVDLAPEKADIDQDPATPGVEIDPTGNLVPSRLLAAAIEALKTPGSAIDVLSDYISVKSLSPDEDSQADYGRLVRTIIVLYRVRSDDENVLLAEGMNA